MKDWINLKDATPRNEEACLVYDGKSRGIAIYDNGFDNDIVGRMVAEMSGEEYTGITHWMPLPNPPTTDS